MWGVSTKAFVLGDSHSVTGKEFFWNSRSLCTCANDIDEKEVDADVLPQISAH